MGDTEGLSQEVVKPTNRETVRQRESHAHRRRLECATQWEIAQELGISQQAVSKILRRVDGRILRQMEADVQLTKVRQARRLEGLYQEAVRGWRESCEIKQKRFHCREDRTGCKITGWTEQSPPRGDPRFLAAALAVLESERRLWGIGGAPAQAVQLNMVAGTVEMAGPPQPPALEADAGPNLSSLDAPRRDAHAENEVWASSRPRPPCTCSREASTLNGQRSHGGGAARWRPDDESG